MNANPCRITGLPRKWYREGWRARVRLGKPSVLRQSPSQFRVIADNLAQRVSQWSAQCRLRRCPLRVPQTTGNSPVSCALKSCGRADRGSKRHIITDLDLCPAGKMVARLTVCNELFTVLQRFAPTHTSSIQRTFFGLERSLTDVPGYTTLARDTDSHLGETHVQELVFACAPRSSPEVSERWR